MQQGPGSDESRVFNLIKAIGGEASAKGAQQPFLVPFAERAERIIEAMEERQTSTAEALVELEKLAEEKIAMQRARADSRLSNDAFAVFWFLHKEELAQPEALAGEIDALFVRFANHAVNADEHRQLKGEMLKLLLLRHVDGPRLIRLADQLLALSRE